METKKIVFEDYSEGLWIEFDKVSKFDCQTLHFDNYCTNLPISRKKYREEQKKNGRTMKAKVKITKTDTYTFFEITDDYGLEYKVSLPNNLEQEIEEATTSADEQGLLGGNNK